MRSALIWTTAILMASIGLVTLALAFHLEFTRWSEVAITVDELFFASCAARSFASGEIAISGCQDSKAPFIFVLYQILLPSEPGYDLLNIKIAAAVTVGLLISFASSISWRLAGPIAALVTAALVAQVFSSHAILLGLKTEVVGGVFMLAGTLILLMSPAVFRFWPIVFSGIFFGLAVVTKQTYAFAAFGVILWMAFQGRGAFVERLAHFLKWSFLFGLAVLVPFFAFFLVFHLRGEALDFLASFFLYPSVYMAEADFTFYKKVVWFIGSASEVLFVAPLVFASFWAGGTLLIVRLLSANGKWDSQRSLELLVFIQALAMFLMLFISPVAWSFHYIPAWLLMAIVGGVIIARTLVSPVLTDIGVRSAFAVGLVSFTVLSAGAAWYSEGGKKQSSGHPGTGVLVDAAPGDHAYVLGMWPHFYVYNNMIPASGIMFPWALPDAPGFWGYQPPTPESLKGRWMGAMQESNLERLLADFSETPPRFIVVFDEMRRSSGGPQADITGLPRLDTYIKTHCQQLKEVDLGRMGMASVLECAAP